MGPTGERIGSRDVMKAIVQDRYGSPGVLELKELEKPVVKDREVLMRVHAAAVNPLDWHFVRGQPYVARVAFGLPKPKVRVRGVDVARVVHPWFLLSWRARCHRWCARGSVRSLRS